ncbi:hypothetical protein, partial [Bradyrhizobium sp. 62]|uniref:beta strand repeat-containing protein n=1 Tax=Bradyrhizobium sp. 62 TaxID=1043588 RepID=UPI001FF937D7
MVALFRARAIPSSIAAAPGDPAITIGSSAGVVKIASLNSDRPITIASGATLQAATFDTSRNIALAGGTIQGGVISETNGAVITVSTDNSAGNLVGVTLNGDATITGANSVLRVSSGLTLNGTIHVAGASTQVRSFGDQAFAGNGTISFEGTTGSIRRLTIEGSSTLTIASTFKVVGGYSSIGDYWESGGTKNLINNGLISSSTSGQTLTLLSYISFLNAGTVEAISGGVLTITPASWTNTGSVHLDANAASTVNLGGSLNATGGIGTFNRSGGVVNLTGTLSNVGSTLALNATTGSWNFFGTISGGSVSLADGAALLLASDSAAGTFTNGVTLNGDLTVSGNFARLRVSGGMTLNGTIHLINSFAMVRALDTQTFGGNGTISFEGTTGSPRRLTIEGASTLTLGSTFNVVGGYGTIGEQWEANGANGLVNNGLISASVNGQQLSVAVGTTFANSGTMEAVGGGILSLANAWTNSGTLRLDANTASSVNLGGTFTTAAIGAISRAGGVINLTGTLNNTGASLTLNSVTGSWNFLGTITGGTVVFADAASLLLASDNASGTFTNGVTLNGDLTVSGNFARLRVSGGMTLNGTIHLTNSFAMVRALDSQTFGGAGTISFEGTTGTPRRLTIEGASTLTLAGTFKVVGGYGSIGEQWETNGTNKLINNGLISANTAGQTLTASYSASFSNAGTMEAVAGGILSLVNSWANTGTLHLDANAASTVNLGGTFATAGLGTIDRTGGVINLTGTLNNAGATLTLNTVTGSWNFYGMISGGTIVLADGSALLIATDNASGTFTNGVTLNGDLTVSGNFARLRVSGGMTLNGTIHLTNSYAMVRALDSQTFAGNGKISFEGTTGTPRRLAIEGASTLTLASTFNVVGGNGTIGEQWETNGTNNLVNNGLINANVAGQSLTASVAGVFTNAGVFQATNGGTAVANNVSITSTGIASATDSTMTLGGNWINSGAINVVNSTLNLGGAFATAGIGTINRTGGIVNLTGALNNAGATLMLNAATGSWNFYGTISAGTIVLADGAALLIAADNASGTFINGVTLNGDLSVSGNFARLRVSGGMTLNGTIHLTNSYAMVRALDTQTFGGSGTISFEGATGTPRRLTIEGASTLTLASTFNVVGGNGTIGEQWETNGTNNLVNNGLINANVAGQSLTASVAGVFTNAGMFQAANGGTAVANNVSITSTGIASATDSTITLGGNWINSGAINIVNSMLNLGGAFATAAIGTINRTGGTVNLTGTLNNAGKILTLNAASGSWNFYGTIAGGTVVFADAASLMLAADNASGTFTNAVTLDGDLTVSGNFARLRVSGGMTLNGTIHLTNSYAMVHALDTQTFGGAGTI